LIWLENRSFAMKTILLPFHDEDAGRTALEAACVVAQQFGSYLEGLLVREGPHIDFGPGISIPPDYLSEAAAEWRRFAESVRKHFVGVTGERGMPLGEVESAAEGPTAGWHELEGRESDVVGAYGRLFDLIVIGRTTRDPTARWQATCEGALFETGRPVLLATPRAPKILGGTTVIAWNGSTETARTVALAMPLLASAAKVVVLAVEGDTVTGPHAGEMAAHLARNGIKASATTVHAAGRTIGDAILEEAAALGADLLVKGAYTRNRLRQIIFGGATQHVLRYAAIPLLMAH
jgi:nucleotide-binding universal stress UspA family protein